jgi:hypothetical protein
MQIPFALVFFTSGTFERVIPPIAKTGIFTASEISRKNSIPLGTISFLQSVSKICPFVKNYAPKLYAFIASSFE